MTETIYRELVVLAGAGLGTAGAGAVQYLAGRRTWLVVTGLVAGAAGAGFGAAAALDPAAGRIAAALTVVLAGSSLLLGSSWLTAALAAFRRPAARAAGVAVIGLTLLVAGIVRYESRDDAEISATLDWMERLSERPRTNEIPGLLVTTDRATRIQPREATTPRSDAELRVLTRDLMNQIPLTGAGMVRGPASDTCNCHGWVFTGGRYWLSPDDVQKILNENGYTVVTTPQPGDLAIYRQGEEIIHTAVVRAVGKDIPVLVEGKWGWLGVYLHPVDASCYGKSVIFYRSSRTGHLLVGLGGKAPASDPEMLEGGQ